MSKPIGWSTVQEKFRGTKAPLKINDLASRLAEARREIDEQAKYYNMQWKKDALQALKAEALELFSAAIDEANAVNKQYEDKINSIVAQQYTGARVNKDDIAAIEYELKSLKAELNMAADKNKVVERYLATQTGAKAVMLMFSEKDLDLGLWTQSIYEQAFVKSKSKAELDFEAQKGTQIAELQAQQAQDINIGKLLAAQRIMMGNANNGVPSLERQFDLDIAACDQEMRTERETLKAEARRDMARDMVNGGNENDK